MNIIILKNVPNINKLQEMAKQENKKNVISDSKDNPPKNKDKSRKTIKFEVNQKEKRKSKLNKKSLKSSKSSKTIAFSNALEPITAFNEKYEKYKLSKKTVNIVNLGSSGHNYSLYTKISNKTLIHDESPDENIENKDLNSLAYRQALRIDKRNCFQIFLAVISHEIKIINIFYYKHPYEHLSLILSQYAFELCLDLTLNSLLYTEDVISEKYNNNGSIKFFTTLSLSFISNIISSIFAFIISKLIEYADFFEFIIKDVVYKSSYYLNMLKFKKLLCIKLTFFFFIQTILNIAMCYYLMIFCTIYHNTQGSIIINYITGIAESMAISFGLTLIITVLRVISIRCRLKSIYYTSKYFFENF